MAKITPIRVDPTFGTIVGVGTPTAPANAIGQNKDGSYITPTAPATPAAPVASPTVQAIRNARTPAPVADPNVITTPGVTQSEAGQTMNISTEQYAAGVAKVGKEKMDASMQKYINQGGALTGENNAVLTNNPTDGNLVSSKNQLPTLPTPAPVPTDAPTETPAPAPAPAPAPGTPTVPPVPEVTVPKIPVTQDEAFQTLMAGGSLPDDKNSAIWKSNFDRYNSFANLDNATIANRVASGDFYASDLTNLSKYNPQKYAEIQKGINDAVSVGNINANNKNLFTLSDGGKVEIVRQSDAMLNDILDTFDKTEEKYSDIVAEAYANNPEIKKQAEELAVMDDSLENLNEQKSKVYEQLRTQYPDVPQAMLIGMASRLTYDIDQQINGLSRQQKLLYSKYKDNKDMLDKGIDYDIAQKEKSTERQLAMKQFLYGNLRDDEIRQEDFEIAEDRIDKNREFTLEDREAAKIENLGMAMSQIGAQFDANKTYEENLAEYATVAKAKLDRGEKLDWFQAETSRNQSSGNDSDSWGEIKPNPTGEGFIQSSKNGQIRVFDDDMNLVGGESSVPTVFTSRALGDKEVGVNEVDGGYEVNIAEGTALGQCGTFGNDYGLRLEGFKKVGDSWESKYANRNSDKPVAGGMFMYTPGAIEGGNGHIGMVERVNSDGSFDVFDTNYKKNKDGVGIADRRTIKPGDKEYKLLMNPKTGGFFAPTQSAQNAGSDIDKDLLGDIKGLINQQEGGTIDGKNKAISDIRKSLKEQDFDGVKRTLNRNFENYLTGTNKTDYQSDKAYMTQIDDYAKALDDYIRANGDTSLLKGTAEQVRNRIIKKTNDKELAKLGVRAIDLTDILGRKRTGAVINDGEVKSFERMTPQITNDPKLNRATIDGFKANLNAKTELYRQSWIKENIGEESYNKIYKNNYGFDGADLVNIQDLLTGKIQGGDKPEDLFSYIQSKGLNPASFNYK